MNDLTSTDRVRIKELSEESLKRVLEALPQKNSVNTGGFLRIFVGFDPKKGLRGWHQIFSSEVGHEESKANKEVYEIYSMEKAIRLMKRFALFGECSSFQSRNPESWEKGGAVTFLSCISDPLENVQILVSFSGLPEEADEAFVLLLMKKLGWQTDSSFRNAEEIVALSKNTLAKEVLK